MEKWQRNAIIISFIIVIVVMIFVFVNDKLELNLIKQEISEYDIIVTQSAPIKINDWEINNSGD